MGVIVNGIKVSTSLKVCNRCVQDTTVPGIYFDDKGECNFCALHDKMENLFPNDERGEAFLKKTFDKIKADGKNKKFDCVVGISGEEIAHI